jgi:hypothetical protein
MPRAADILDGLSAIASQATSVAVAWHILIRHALLALWTDPQSTICTPHRRDGFRVPPWPWRAASLSSGNGLGSRAWALTLAAVALSYGLFGELRLDVFLDIPLVIGAIALVVAELHAFKGARKKRGHDGGAFGAQGARSLRMARSALDE